MRRPLSEQDASVVPHLPAQAGGPDRREPAALRWSHRRTGDAPMKLKLDLHDIYNRGQDIDRALRDIMDEAVRKKAPMVEIIPGKGSGQLKKHVLRFLEQKEIKAMYHRVEKDSKNFGRLFVHFRYK
jgi:DNA-nicking Smr family endonuclease